MMGAGEAFGRDAARTEHCRVRGARTSARLRAHRVELQESMERRLLGPLRGLGLSPIEPWIVVDAMLSVMHHVTRAVWAGEAAPDEAVELLLTVSSRVIQRSLNDDGHAQVAASDQRMALGVVTEAVTSGARIARIQWTVGHQVE